MIIAKARRTNLLHGTLALPQQDVREGNAGKFTSIKKGQHHHKNVEGIMLSCSVSRHSAHRRPVAISPWWRRELYLGTLRPLWHSGYLCLLFSGVSYLSTTPRWEDYTLIGRLPCVPFIQDYCIRTGVRYTPLNARPTSCDSYQRLVQLWRAQGAHDFRVDCFVNA